MQKKRPFHSLRSSSSEKGVERCRYVRRESRARSRVVRLLEARDLMKGLLVVSEVVAAGIVGGLRWVDVVKVLRVGWDFFDVRSEIELMLS